LPIWQVMLRKVLRPQIPGPTGRAPASLKPLQRFHVAAERHSIRQTDSRYGPACRVVWQGSPQILRGSYRSDRSADKEQ
jgi:hypothetical protein